MDCEKQLNRQQGAIEIMIQTWYPYLPTAMKFSDEGPTQALDLLLRLVHSKLNIHITNPDPSTCPASSLAHISHSKQRQWPIPTPYRYHRNIHSTPTESAKLPPTTPTCQTNFPCDGHPRIQQRNGNDQSREAQPPFLQPAEPRTVAQPSIHCHAEAAHSTSLHHITPHSLLALYRTDKPDTRESEGGGREPERVSSDDVTPHRIPKCSL
jgi:hypothetical protein